MAAQDEVKHLADIPLKLDVQLDQVTLTVEQLLRLEPGHTVTLTRSAGDNIDIVVGGSLLGYGEIVIIEDTMGVRITDFRAD